MNDINSVIQRFRDAMAEQGITTRTDILADGELNRFRVEGDPAGTKHGWYKLVYDETPAGMFGCNKRHGDHKFRWKDKTDTKPMTAAERKAQEERIAANRARNEAERVARETAAAERAVQIWEQAAPCENHPYLERKLIKSHGLRVGKWEVINESTGEVNTITENALLVPIHGVKKNDIRSLQAIFPSKLMGDRDKDYLKNGAKTGNFFSIGKPLHIDERPVFILCEGYATADSIHEATGHYVVACFDTSNLLNVGRIIRARQPHAIILYAADNDQWTIKPVENPGVHFAKKAAEEIRALVCYPPFDNSEGIEQPNGKIKGPTDYNDMRVRQGLDAVAEHIMSALEPREPELDASDAFSEATEYEEPITDLQPPTEPVVPLNVGLMEHEEDQDEMTKNGHFVILGYDGGDYFYFSHAKKQVMRFRRMDITDMGLLEMAPLQFWELYFSDGKGGIDKKATAQWLFALAHARGIYDPSRQRGRGAWRDKGRVVFHHGDHLSVDGVHTELTAIDSWYVYPRAARLPLPKVEPMTDEEGKRILSIAEMVRWSKPSSAALMAGWTFLAPISGILDWRPHIWITGAAGSGKSTVQSSFCRGLTGKIGIYAQGNSTEPGIRQKIKGDAIPLMMDEAESNKPSDIARMEAVLSMVRQSSSESQAETYKGSASGDATSYLIRSMTCLASINTNLGNKADSDRLVQLVINPPSSADTGWLALKDELHLLETDSSISDRFISRSLGMIPVIVEAVNVFRVAAAKRFGSQRMGDQFGTLIAGCWCLTNSEVPTREQADVVVLEYDFSEHTELQADDDSSQALQYLMNAKIKIGGGLPDLTVYELVRLAHPHHHLESDSVTMGDADSALKRHGFKLSTTEAMLKIGTSVPNLVDLIKNTRYSTDIRGQLLRVPGATKNDNKTERFMGKPSKPVCIPLDIILGDPGIDLPDSPNKLF